MAAKLSTEPENPGTIETFHFSKYRNLAFIWLNLLRNGFEKATVLFKPGLMISLFVLQTTVEKVCVNELQSERWEVDLSWTVLCFFINYVYPLIYLSFSSREFSLCMSIEMPYEIVNLECSHQIQIKVWLYRNLLQLNVSACTVCIRVIKRWSCPFFLLEDRL